MIRTILYRTIVVLPLLAVMWGTLLFAAEAKPTSVAPPLLPVAEQLASLRLAIADLATRSPAYPAKDFLARLAALETRQSVQANDPALIKDLVALRREILLAHPALVAHPILFTTYTQFAQDHHNTETIFVTGECNTAQYKGGGSALKVLDLAAGSSVRTLVDAGPQGLARNPEVHFDGTRVLFSMRSSVTDDYHIYEVQTDGSGLKQLTRLKGAADFDPIYVPDGSIVFSSTREPKYCGCNIHIMANLYRMDGDGSNIHRIGGSTLFEGHSRLLPDGRILYDRWEYVDRNFGDAQGLWTMNPDGTGHAIYWGNNTASPGGVIQARPVPGTNLVIGTLGSCHDRPWGALGIIDRQRGIDATAENTTPIVMTWPRQAIALVGKGGFDTFKKVRPRYQDPYPLDESFVLCAREVADADWTGAGPKPKIGIYLVDVFGNEALIHAEAPSCFQPVLLAPRPRPPVLPVRRAYDHSPATVYISDVAMGTHMQGVQSKDIKWLRVVESPEKRHWTVPVWGGQGSQRPAMNWHNFENKRILGTVPVEEDGSAYLEIPADTFVFFQALDQDGMMIQSMRSGVTFQPGERASCIGCHEDRLTATPQRSGKSLAFSRAPSRLAGWRGNPRLFSYMTEVQPVWNNRCVSCHDFGKPAGQKLNLAGDRDIAFNASYESLHQRWKKPDGYLNNVGAGPADIQPARSWGAGISPLVTLLKQGAAFKPHESLKLEAEDWDRIITWIDLNAPYYPTYATAYPDGAVGRNPLTAAEMKTLKTLTGVDLDAANGFNTNRGPYISFDRPALSPCLAKLGGPTDERYAKALAIITLGQERLHQTPRGDTLDFTPCATDQQREEKYLERAKREEQNRAAIREGRKVYDP